MQTAPREQLALGMSLWARGDRAAALRALEAAVAGDPALVEGRNNLGNALLALGRPGEAIAQYRAGLAVAPDRPDLLYNLGNALVAGKDTQAAEAAFRAALALRPDHAGTHNNLGGVLRGQRRHEEALACYRQAQALSPDIFGILNNVGSALLALHRPDEALPLLERALALQPDYAEACNNMGGAMLALDRPPEAIDWFRRALRLDPDNAQARFGEGLGLLSLGEFRRGWPAYQARWQDPRFLEDTPDYPDPPWLGAGPIAGQRLLLHAEQGLGDTIQFVRYAPLLRRRGAHVVLQVQAALVPLVRHLADEVVAMSDTPALDPLPAYDLRCPLLSLPLACSTRLATIPRTVPYLFAPADRVAAWRDRLGVPSCLRIGVAFSGSPDHPDDALRSIPAARLLPALARPGVELHVVQKDIRPDDRAALARLPGLRWHDAALGDFADTAALLAVMDAVVSVDTSIVHLAGALGRPCLVLLQFAADFRWLRARQDSPWYPTLLLFRQVARGDWAAPVAAVGAALDAMAARPPTQGGIAPP